MKSDEVIVIRGNTAEDCMDIALSIKRAGRRLMPGPHRVAFTTGAGPFVMVVECLPETS